jgi:purine-binding chemotaxis protein CheW
MNKEGKNGSSNDVGSGISQLVAFSLDDRRFAVALSTVKRIERIVAVTPLPKAPAIVTGIVNFHGQVIPVVDIRSRFNLPFREPELNDHLLVLDTGRRVLAFIVDAAEGVIDASADQYADRKEILPGMDYVKGVVKLEDGMILIHDPETFLSLEEEHTLDAAMKETRHET